MFFLAYILVAAFVVTPPTPFDVTLADGTIAHVDYTDNPCGTRGPWAGCAQTVDGVKHIWHSGVAPDNIVQHEKDHVNAGFRHGEWYVHRYFGNCANITQGAGKYPTGGMVCTNDRGRERIVPPGYQDEDCMECRVSGPNPPMAPHPFFRD